MTVSRPDGAEDVPVKKVTLSAANLPGGPDLTFSDQVAKRGEHRLFLEFSVDGQAHRAEFTVFVS